jgi:hypothetical protein
MPAPIEVKCHRLPLLCLFAHQLFHLILAKHPPFHLRVAQTGN